ncbi:11464_t:CDS:2, partial [Entrophospora sp. SA101]
ISGATKDSVTKSLPLSVVVIVSNCLNHYPASHSLTIKIKR